MEDLVLLFFTLWGNILGRFSLTLWAPFKAVSTQQALDPCNDPKLRIFRLGLLIMDHCAV